MMLSSLFRSSALSLKELNYKLKSAFGKIKEEMEDHLLAINENTNEISSQYEYICELENKIEKLQERVEQLQLCVYGSIQTTKADFSASKLTKNEQNVFTALYTLEEEKGSVTFKDISLALSISEQDVEAQIDSLMAKNVPIKKKHLDSNTYLNIDEDFKIQQAKENVLKIEH